MTRPITSREESRPLHSEPPPAASPEATLATARRLSEAYCHLFTIICESGVRLLVPARKLEKAESVEELTPDSSDDTLENTLEGEPQVCCGGRQENLRRRLRRALAFTAVNVSQEERQRKLCSRLVTARSRILARSGLDRREVDRFVDELIAVFEERQLDSSDGESAESLLRYDAPVAILRREALRLSAARSRIHVERASMVNANRRLVMRVARRFMGRGLPFEDLVQEGTLGLMRAIDKFEPERGFRFSTYAMWWIRQGVSRAIVDQSRTVRLPVHLSETLARIRRTENRLTALLQRKPELSELANALQLSEERLLSLLQKVSVETSMQKPLSDSTAEFGDLIADESAEQGLGFAEQNTLKELLGLALDRLDSRSRYVVQAHHGLSGVRPLTLGDIGKVLGLSRERVRQIENEAFQRLRKVAREQHLDDFV